jgi:hypothetical protein
MRIPAGLRPRRSFYSSTSNDYVAAPCESLRKTPILPDLRQLSRELMGTVEVSIFSATKEIGPTSRTALERSIYDWIRLPKFFYFDLFRQFDRSCFSPKSIGHRLDPASQSTEPASSITAYFHQWLRCCIAALFAFLHALTRRPPLRFPGTVLWIDAREPGIGPTASLAPSTRRTVFTAITVSNPPLTLSVRD